MKRLGYTLAEALIAMVVIGVIAAVTLPLASKFMPDGNKVLFLKTYDSIIEATQSMTSSTELYPIVNNQNAGGIIYKNYPLANTYSVTLDGQTYSGAKKYCQLLALALNASNPTCSQTGSLVAENAVWDSAPSFVAPNGVTFWVYSAVALSSGSSVTYQSDVWIDVNGKGNGADCIYAAGTCEQPDRFKVMVASDGEVVAADPKAKAYLQKRSNWRINRDEKELPGDIVASLEGSDKTKALELIPEAEGTQGGSSNTDGNGNSGSGGSGGSGSGGSDDGSGTGTGDGGLDFTPLDPLEPRVRKTCTGCGRQYTPSTTCTCPSCGTPILCSAEDELAIESTPLDVDDGVEELH